MLYSFSNFSSPAFSSSFLSTLPSSSRRLLYHSPAFDPFAPFTETFGFTGVDYPMSQVGSGAGAYLKAMGKSNTIAFYRNHFCLLNITPHTLNRMRKTRRRLFYVTHYCTLFRQGQYYTVELMWPVWVGKAPKGVLTQALPGWHNPFLKDEWQEFHIAEFAFVNLRYLWPYDHSWQRLDINRSPLAPAEVKTWWKETFLPAVKIRSEDTFGYSIFRFSEGYHDAPSHIPPMAYEAEKHFTPETDRYKAAMGAVAAQASEVPEHYWWTSRQAETIPFISKWEPLGLAVEADIPTYYSFDFDSRLPNGKWVDPRDPSRQNLTKYFNKTSDPTTYFLRSEHSPGPATLVDYITKHYDKEMDPTPPLHIDTGGPLPLWQDEVEQPSMDLEHPSDDSSDDEEAIWKHAWDPDGPPLDPVARAAWIKKPRNQKIMDSIIKETIAAQIKEGKKSFPLTRAESRQTRARLLRLYREENGVIPETGPATEANEESYLSSDSDSEWSSDEEVGYSASWMNWGDVTEYSEQGAWSQHIQKDVADEVLEVWAETLREEQGAINDTLDFGEFQDYDPKPEPNRYFQDFVDPREWPEPDVGGTFPVYHDPRIDYSQETRWSWFPDSWAVPKKAEDFFLWQDGRREE